GGRELRDLPRAARRADRRARDARRRRVEDREAARHYVRVGADSRAVPGARLDGVQQALDPRGKGGGVARPRLRPERRGLRALRARGEQAPHPPGGARHPAVPARRGRMSPANAADRGVGVGLIGLGTIGTGVAKVLRRNAAVIEQRLGFPLRLVRIAELDPSRADGVDLSGIRFDADADGLIADPEVSIAIELIGGYDAARRLILRAIEAGKHVVTANKALLALHGAEIFGAAARRGVDV